MRLLVLGSTGYLGKKIVRKMADEGHTILCIVRRPVTENYWGPGEISWALFNNFEEKLCSSEPYDYALNFACKYSRNGNGDKEIYEANLFNPLIFFTICAKNGVNNLLTIDTGLPYTLNSYAMSKHLLSEKLKWDCSKNNNLNVVNIRLENFYGEDEPKDRFIHSMIAKLKLGMDLQLTEGNQIRDFIYIQDVIDNIIHILNLDLHGYHDIPLGTGDGVSIRNLMLFLKETIGSESCLLFGAVKMRTGEPDSVADKNIMDLYGITIRFDWKTGMKMLVGATI